MQVRDLDDLKSGIKHYGFDAFWSLFIQTYLHKKRPDLQPQPSELDIDINAEIVSFDNIGELYEIGLEFDNQISKKELGQYYTPKDVSEFMAQKTLSLFNPKTDVLADVCSGTGNLIIEVLSLLDKKAAQNIVKSNELYLYDLDNNAMQLAIMKISILFIAQNDTATFKNIHKLIHVHPGNFLDDNITLPKNSVAISNPPYGKLPKDILIWNECRTQNTRDLYSVFIDKIATQAKNAVIISPQSFLGGSKFTSLRGVMSQFGGSIYSFDNIPCPIFTGRKKGIFNTNTANSVRAAITIIDKSQHGFRVSPMIRFRAEERQQMFAELDNLIGNVKYFDDSAWTKIPKSLEPIVAQLEKADRTVKDLIESSRTHQRDELKITVPSTPRYFITGSRRSLDRSSKIEIYARDQESFNKLYLMINSTFSYLWWRIYDGGITLTKQTLLTMPVPNITTNQMKQLVDEGLRMEDSYVVNKMNAGKNNENIKFPDEYRKKVNDYVLSSINHQDLAKNLLSIHANNLTTVLPLWT